VNEATLGDLGYSDGTKYTASEDCAFTKLLRRVAIVVTPKNRLGLIFIWIFKVRLFLKVQVFLSWLQVSEWKIAAFSFGCQGFHNCLCQVWFF
jgi:hypothetical protein